MHNPLRAGQPNAYHYQSCSLQLVRGCSNSVWAPLFYFTPHLNVCRGTQMLADFPFVLLGAQGHRLGVCGVDTRFTALCPPDPCPPFGRVPSVARRAPTLGSPRAVQDRISHPCRVLLSRITSKQILLWDKVHQIKTRGRAGPTGEDSSLGPARFCSLLSGVSFGFVTEAVGLLPLVSHQKKSKNKKKGAAPSPPALRGGEAQVLWCHLVESCRPAPGPLLQAVERREKIWQGRRLPRPKFLPRLVGGESQPCPRPQGRGKGNSPWERAPSLLLCGQDGDAGASMPSGTAPGGLRLTGEHPCHQEIGLTWGPADTGFTGGWILDTGFTGREANVFPPGEPGPQQHQEAPGQK